MEHSSFPLNKGIKLQDFDPSSRSHLASSHSHASCQSPPLPLHAPKVLKPTAAKMKRLCTTLMPPKTAAHNSTGAWGRCMRLSQWLNKLEHLTFESRQCSEGHLVKKRQAPNPVSAGSPQDLRTTRCTRIDGSSQKPCISQ